MKARKFKIGDKAILTDEYFNATVVTIDDIDKLNNTFPYSVSTESEVTDNEGCVSRLRSYPAKISEIRPLTKLDKALT